MYLEKYESNPDKLFEATTNALQSLVDVALQISQLAKITGLSKPTVIT
jgi:hypothetical protein